MGPINFPFTLFCYKFRQISHNVCRLSSNAHEFQQSTQYDVLKMHGSAACLETGWQMCYKLKD